MSCGGCTLCCTLMKVEMAPRAEPTKPAMTACQHCAGRGCAVYDARPKACREFECLWLTSQQWGVKAMPKGERPDRTGIVMEVNSKGNIIAHCRTPEAWRGELARNRLQRFVDKGVTVTLEHGDGRVSLLERDGTPTALEFMGLDPETNETMYRRPLPGLGPVVKQEKELWSAIIR